MTAALSLVACVVLAGVLCRRWYHSALAAQAAQDAAALAACRFGRYHSSPAMAAPYDQQKAAQAHKRQQRQAAHARAQSRKAQDRVTPATVPVPFRRAK